MTFLSDDTTEEHERRIVRCREQSCRTQIIFLPHHMTGKPHPTDADTVSPEDTEFNPAKHTSHFATCKAPGKFRKPRS